MGCGGSKDDVGGGGLSQAARGAAGGRTRTPEQIQLSRQQKQANETKDGGNIEGALSMMYEVLQGREVHCGKSAPETCETVYMIGQCYQDLNRLDEALPMYLRALEGYETGLGPEHPDTLIILESSASVFVAQKKLSEAQICSEVTSWDATLF